MPPGPLNSDDETATVQEGPIGASRTYSVSGSLTFSTGGAPSTNLFDISASAGTGVAYGQAIPAGGPYGNDNTNGPTGITIGTWVEFGTQFYSSGLVASFPPDALDATNQFATSVTIVPSISPVQLQVLGNLDDTRSITITTQKMTSSVTPLSNFVGTLTVTSSLFAGATDVILTWSTPPLEHVLADSFELDEEQQGAKVDAAAAATAPSDSTAPEPLSKPEPSTKALRPAQTSPISGVVTNQAAGQITFTLPSATWVPVSSEASFTVVSSTTHCSAHGSKVSH
jgi:hypothetical protein